MLTAGTSIVECLKNVVTWVLYVEHMLLLNHI